MRDLNMQMISVKELAEKLALSKRTIWRILERGEIQTITVGRRRLIPLAEVRAWLCGVEPEAFGTNWLGEPMAQTTSHDLRSEPGKDI